MTDLARTLLAIRSSHVDYLEKLRWTGIKMDLIKQGTPCAEGFSDMSSWA